MEIFSRSAMKKYHNALTHYGYKRSSAKRVKQRGERLTFVTYKSKEHGTRIMTLHHNYKGL